jgi:hypothetical protein
MNSKGKNHISGIKPVGTSILHRINQVIMKELILAKLDPAATKNMGVIAAGLGFQTEEVTKEKGEEEFQGKFRKDGQKQKDGGQHWE